MTSVSGVPCNRDAHPLGECPRCQMCPECGEYAKDCECQPGRTATARADRRPQRQRFHKPPCIGQCSKAPHPPGMYCHTCARRARHNGDGASTYAQPQPVIWPEPGGCDLVNGLPTRRTRRRQTTDEENE